MPLTSLPPRDERVRTARARAQLVRGRRDWYRIRNAADEAEIFIYDEIGFWGITADDFVRELRGVSAKRITLRLNTPGGDVFDGIAIYTALREHPAEVTARVDSLAASIGSVIAMAADRIQMARHATLMIHEPFGIVVGDAADMRKQADVLDQLGDEIAAVYADRAGGSVRDWRDRMREETWYTDRAAVEAGLADEVSGEASEPKDTFDLSIFRHPPHELLVDAPRSAQNAAPTKREIERALRDVGLSQSQAKALMSAGRDILEPGADQREVAELVRLHEVIKDLNRR